MGHLNNFLALGGGNLNKNFRKIQMPGGLPGGGCLSFDLTGTLHLLFAEQSIKFGERFMIIWGYCCSKSKDSTEEASLFTRRLSTR